MRRTLRAVALIAVVVGLSGACSADEKKSEGVSGVPVSPASSSSSSSASESSGVGPLAVRAVENGDLYSFDLGGATEVPSGPVAISLTNNGTQPHQATLVKIMSGK